MRIELDVRTAVAIFLVVLVVLGGAGAVATELGAQSVEEDAPVADAVELEDGSTLWPYTSKSHAFEDGTLAINLVIYGDASYTEYILRDAPFSDWEELPEDREDLAPAEVDSPNESTLGWGGARGADRYVWVDPAGEADGVWLAEAYQLERGQYLGDREHIRAYEDPGTADWTALQAHDEHWDWFHLRHTVHSVEDTQSSVEGEFAESWYPEEYYRAHFGNDRGSDGNGWVTIIRLDGELMPIVFGGLVLVGGVTNMGRNIGAVVRTDPAVRTGLHALLLIAVLGGSYLGIRFGALALERALPGLSPKLIVLGFYPLLVVGMPVLAYLSARRLDATVAFWAGTIGFVAGILLDYTFLGVMRLPVETFVHRAALAIAIGMIAAGASHTARSPDAHRGYVRTGVLLWLVAIVLPLLQFL